MADRNRAGPSLSSNETPLAALSDNCTLLTRLETITEFHLALVVSIAYNPIRRLYRSNSHHGALWHSRRWDMIRQSELPSWSFTELPLYSAVLVSANVGD